MPIIVMDSAEGRAWLAKYAPHKLTREEARADKSVLVTTLTREIAEAGLPAPVPEWRFHPVRRWQIDLAYPLRKVAIEVEGGIWIGWRALGQIRELIAAGDPIPPEVAKVALGGRHNNPAGFTKDAEKYAELACAGWRLLRVPPGWIGNGKAVGYITRLLKGR